LRASELRLGKEQLREHRGQRRTFRPTEPPLVQHGVGVRGSGGWLGVGVGVAQWLRGSN
jgi:hypothetical protein